MANKKKQNKNPAQKKKPRKAKQLYFDPGKNTYFGIDRRIIYGILMLIALAFYANTIPNEYALDDGIVIEDNSFTKQGISGIPEILSYDTMAGEHGKDVNFVSGGRYRPLSVITLAIEYELFNMNPHISHFVNTVLYGFVGILIFLVFDKLLRHKNFYPYRKKWYLAIPFVTAVIYLIHPVHTETVANIKGRDEIMALMGALGAFWYVIKYHETDTNKYLIISAIIFFLGLLSKENTITFLAVIPIGTWFFTRSSLKKTLFSVIPIVIATIAFLILRKAILGSDVSGTTHELMNNPFVEANSSEKFATIFLTLGKYVQLLIFPHPLTWDYYPYHIPLINWGDWRAIIPLLFYFAIGIYALLRLGKKQQIISYSIWIYLAGISIVSNIFITIGSFMSERFLFLPSVGFALLAAYLLAGRLPFYLEKKGVSPKKAIGGILSILMLLTVVAGAKTIDRNTDWKNNFTLFTHDVQISTGSAKGHTTAGEQLLLAGIDEKNDSIAGSYFQRAEKHLKKAIDIHPKYIAPRLDLGLVYERYQQDYDKAIDYYISTLKLNPNYEKAYQNIKNIFRRIDSTDFEINVYKRLYEINPNRYDINYKLGSMYGAYKNNLEKSIFHLKKAINANPKKAEAYTDLGVAYGMSKQYKKAIEALEQAVKLNTKDPLAYANLAATHGMMGNKEKQAKYEKIAEKMKKRQQQRQQQRRKKMKQKQQEQQQEQEQNVGSR